MQIKHHKETNRTNNKNNPLIQSEFNPAKERNSALSDQKMSENNFQP